MQKKIPGRTLVVTIGTNTGPLKNTWHFLMNELLLLKKFIMWERFSYIINFFNSNNLFIKKCQVFFNGHLYQRNHEFSEFGWYQTYMRVGGSRGCLDPPQNPKYPSQTRCLGKILTKKRVFKSLFERFSYLPQAFFGKVPYPDFWGCPHDTNTCVCQPSGQHTLSRRSKPCR